MAFSATEPYLLRFRPFYFCLQTPSSAANFTDRVAIAEQNNEENGFARIIRARQKSKCLRTWKRWYEWIWTILQGSIRALVRPKRSNEGALGQPETNYDLTSP